jgi:tripartite-type tricarboxylate transporter receptor subunit TctC
MRRLLLTLLLLATCAGVSAQTYPNRPIRFVVPFPAGGGVTTIARLVAQRLSEAWGQSVVVDNRPGGNAIIGTEIVAKAAADGYTILFVNIGFITTPLMMAKVPYDPIKDFAAVGVVTASEYVLVVHPSVPVNNLKEFIAYAKARPGQLNYSSSGTGGASHLATEVLAGSEGIKMIHIPFQGAAPALTSVLGGQVQVILSPPVNAVPHILSGRVRALAITGNARFPALPQVPTFGEQGMGSFTEKAWQGIVAPAGTPRAIIDKMAAEIGKFLVEPSAKESLVKQGLDPYLSTPEQFSAMMKSDTEKYAKAIKANNIKLEE